MLSFINCYDFPSLEQGLELQGQTNPTIGNYQLTYDACYPWTTGDIIQYSTSNSTGGVAEIIYTNIIGIECGTLWTDIDELNEIEISIAPNPTNDVVKIQAEQPMKSVRVLDLSGRILFSEEKTSSNLTEISLVSFEKGAYILEIHFANSIQARTIIRNSSIEQMDIHEKILEIRTTRGKAAFVDYFVGRPKDFNEMMNCIFSLEEYPYKE